MENTGRVVTLENLMVKMGWSFTRIDQETQDGTIELCSRSGRTAYKLHKHFVPESAFAKLKKADGRLSIAEVGRYVNRKG